MEFGPRDNAEATQPARGPALAGAASSLDEEHIPTPSRTESFTLEDKEKLGSRRPLTINEQATIQEHPPHFAPPTVVLRPAWIWAGVFVGIPLLLWGLALWTAPVSNDPGLQWAIAATTNDTASVVVRSSTGSPDLAPLSVTRHGNRLVALDSVTGGERWSFPSEASGRLIGASLDDAVLWIPATGSFSSSSTSATPASGDPPVLFVLWINEESVSRRVRLSLLDREGKERWTAPLDPGATPDRFVWVETDKGPLLVYDSPDTFPQRFDLKGGKLPAREGKTVP